MEVEKEKNFSDFVIMSLLEILANCILVSAISVTVATGGNVISIGLGLLLGILLTGSVTGGHVNPAVTLAVFIGGSHYKKIGTAILLMIS